MRGFCWPCQCRFSPNKLGFKLSLGCSLVAVKLPPESFFTLHARLHRWQHPTIVSVAIMDTRAWEIKTGLGENGRKNSKSFLPPHSQSWHNPEPSWRVQTPAERPMESVKLWQLCWDCNSSDILDIQKNSLSFWVPFSSKKKNKMAVMTLQGRLCIQEQIYMTSNIQRKTWCTIQMLLRQF